MTSKSTVQSVRMSDRQAGVIDIMSTLLGSTRSDIVRDLIPPGEDWARALEFVARTEYNGELGDALYALAAEGLRRRLIDAGAQLSAAERLHPIACAKTYLACTTAAEPTP